MSVPFHERENFKRIKNLVIGIGASIVLLGALFKILHWPYASEMLMVGMITESFLFAMLGILPPHQDYYWEKVYPGLNIAPDHYDAKGKKTINLTAAGSSSTASLDKMLDDAKIGPELIDSLGSNLKNFGDQIGKMTNITDAAIATSDFTKNASDASNALSQMKIAYSGASAAMEKMNAAQADTVKYHEQVQADTVKYHEQVQAVSKNLAQLNAMYELELTDANSHLKAMNKFYGSLTTAMSSLEDSVADTQIYRQEMSKLSKQLSTLNQIYGGMLNAMTIKG